MGAASKVQFPLPRSSIRLLVLRISYVLPLSAARGKSSCMCVWRGEAGREREVRQRRRLVRAAAWWRTCPRNQKVFVSQQPGSNPAMSPFSRFTSELLSSFFSPLFFSLARVRGEKEAKNGVGVGRNRSESHISRYWLLLFQSILFGWHYI